MNMNIDFNVCLKDDTRAIYFEETNEPLTFAHLLSTVINSFDTVKTLGKTEFLLKWVNAEGTKITVTNDADVRGAVRFFIGSTPKRIPTFVVILVEKEVFSNGSSGLIPAYIHASSSHDSKPACFEGYVNPPCGGISRSAASTDLLDLLAADLLSDACTSTLSCDTGEEHPSELMGIGSCEHSSAGSNDIEQGLDEECDFGLGITFTELHYPRSAALPLGKQQDDSIIAAYPPQNPSEPAAPRPHELCSHIVRNNTYCELKEVLQKFTEYCAAFWSADATTPTAEEKAALDAGKATALKFKAFLEQATAPGGSFAYFPADFAPYERKLWMQLRVTSSDVFIKKRADIVANVADVSNEHVRVGTRDGIRKGDTINWTIEQTIAPNLLLARMRCGAYSVFRVLCPTVQPRDLCVLRMHRYYEVQRFKKAVEHSGTGGGGAPPGDGDGGGGGGDADKTGDKKRKTPLGSALSAPKASKSNGSTAQSSGGAVNAESECRDDVQDLAWAYFVHGALSADEVLQRTQHSSSTLKATTSGAVCLSAHTVLGWMLQDSQLKRCISAEVPAAEFHLRAAQFKAACVSRGWLAAAPAPDVPASAAGNFGAVDNAHTAGDWLLDAVQGAGMISTRGDDTAGHGRRAATAALREEPVAGPSALWRVLLFVLVLFCALYFAGPPSTSAPGLTYLPGFPPKPPTDATYQLPAPAKVPPPPHAVKGALEATASVAGLSLLVKTYLAADLFPRGEFGALMVYYSPLTSKYLQDSGVHSHDIVAVLSALPSDPFNTALLRNIKEERGKILALEFSAFQTALRQIKEHFEQQEQEQENTYAEDTNRMNAIIREFESAVRLPRQLMRLPHYDKHLATLLETAEMYLHATELAEEPLFDIPQPMDEPILDPGPSIHEQMRALMHRDNQNDEEEEEVRARYGIEFDT